MGFVKYKNRKPKNDGEYLCRFYEDSFHAVKGCEYLTFIKIEGGFQVEHNEYYDLEWYEELTH